MPGYVTAKERREKERRSMCVKCADTGWVCECHGDRPWAGVSNHPRACDSPAGDNCACNQSGETERAMSTTFDLSGDKRH